MSQVSVMSSVKADAFCDSLLDGQSINSITKKMWVNYVRPWNKKQSFWCCLHPDWGISI